MLPLRHRVLFVRKKFPCTKLSGNLGNRYHEAELLNNLDEFFDLNQILVSFTYS